MIARTVPAELNAQEKLGETEQGWAVQVLLLDIDVGPKDVRETAKLMGIRTKLDAVPSEGLGGLRLARL